MMRRSAFWLLALGFVWERGLDAQGRPIDWPLLGGNAQRTGWQKTDSRMTRDNVKDFKLVLKHKLDNKQKGPYSLTPPVIIGMLISYRGFKELAFVSGSGDNFWSLDADLDRVFWERHFNTAGSKKASGGSKICSSPAAATPALIPPLNFGARRAPVTGPTKSPGLPATPAGAPAPARPAAGPGILGAAGFGSPRPVFALASDGKLHVVNTSKGEDAVPAIPFLPAGARASTLTVADGVVYTTTSGDCGGAPNGVWAADLNGADSGTPVKVASFATNGGGLPGTGGLAIGNDGTVYAQTGPGASDASANKWSNTLLALTPKDLKMKGHFAVAGESSGKAGSGSATTPVVFAHKDEDMVVSAGIDGRLYLHSAKSFGGEGEATPLYKTPPLSAAGGGIGSGLSSWQDAEGVRWVAAPVWGAVNPELPSANGAAPNGSLVAFKVEEHEGKPVLTPAWVSRDMPSPVAPVITSGMVFGLAAGEYSRDMKPKGSSHATLYALDAATGKEMYSTGNQVTAPGSLTGVTVANGRVYFTTTDNTLYAFGVYMER